MPSASSFPLLFRILALCVAVALAGPLGAQETAPPEEAVPGELFEKIPLPPGISKEVYQDVLAETLTERGWKMLEKNDRRVSASLSQRGNLLNPRGTESTVTLLFAGATTDLHFVSWEVDREGNRIRPATPRNTLAILRRELSRRLAASASTR